MSTQANAADPDPFATPSNTRSQSVNIDQSVGRSGDSGNDLAKAVAGLTVSTRRTSRERATSEGDSECLYQAERVIGNGSFGIVYQATVTATGDTVAIKKVLQDRRYKNRELQIMRMVSHPNIVDVKDCFYSKGEKRHEIYLNLVMEYIPETIYQTTRNHTRAKQQIPIFFTKVYVYQMCRALAYCHRLGICHRDIKPQNLLLDPRTHTVKLCDFGSAKILVRGEPNTAYISSRYYRAPELIFEAQLYSVSIDIWSLGCVFAELMIGQPLFQGETSVDQLVEIIKVLGAPGREEILAMNNNYTTFKFPKVKPHPWNRVFGKRATKEAIDLISKFLLYTPDDRIKPFAALAHPFFDDLRKANASLPHRKPLPLLFNLTEEELRVAKKLGIYEKIFPPHVRTG